MINVNSIKSTGIINGIVTYLIDFSFDNFSTLPQKIYQNGLSSYLLADGSTATNVSDNTSFVYDNGRWIRNGKSTSPKEDNSNTFTDNGNYSITNNDFTGISNVTVDVSGGGGGGSTSNAVNFYDYDGSIVQSYSAADFANLSELPANPTHEGLTAQGWNWSLADAKSYVNKYGELDIGQMYVTDDGKTRIYITLTEGSISPILQLYLNANSELDIDWGDGGTHSKFTSTSAGYKSERHNYATDGDYVIAITVTTGSFILQSSSNSVSSILWNGDNSTSSPDRAYNNSIKKIEIGTDGVTSIGTYAFNNCPSLTSITIPDSVTSIGDNAFQNCYSLSSITITDSVTSVGGYAFSSCYALTSITIPNGVTSIGIRAFQSCYSLTSITITDSVTSIGTNAFQNCYSLSSITIPDSVTSIGSYAFDSCYALSSITILDGVTSIGGNAFQNCRFMSFIKFESTTPPIVSNSNAWSNVPTSCIIYVPALVANKYMNGTNYPSKSTYTYIGYATYESGITLPDKTTDETHTLTWYATITDAKAGTNPITTGNGEEVYARASA